jgi:uncharacterized membrane protein YhaH (DUF805 family)
MKIAASRADIIVIILAVIFGMSVWVWVDQQVALFISDDEPNVEAFREQNDVPRLERAHVLNANLQKAAQEHLDQVQRDFNEQSAVLDTLTGLYPNISVLASTAISSSVSASATMSPSLQLDYTQKFLDARFKQDVDRRLIVSATAVVTRTEAEIVRMTTDLRKAEQTANQQFHRAQIMYQLIRPVATFAITLIAVCLLFLLLIGLHVIVRRRTPANRRTLPLSLIFLSATGLLLILFGYQAFSIAGAALMALLVFVILFVFIPTPSAPVQNKSEES